MSATVGQLLLDKGTVIVTVTPTTTVYDAVSLMREKNIGSVLVLNAQGKLTGIFSERDALQQVLLAEKPARDVTVQQVMAKGAVYATADRTVDECMALMTHHRVRHLPVLDKEQKVVGIVSIGDLVKYLSYAKDVMIRNLASYIEGSF